MSKCSILVVEDEPIVAEDLKMTLTNLGYDVIAIAYTGELAIEIARSRHPDLILMDIILAGQIDGITAAEQISERQDIPVIYITAYADKTLLQRVKPTFPFGYIIKPFNPNELNVTIEMALYKHALDRKLKESEERFKSVVHNSSDLTILTDAKGIVTFVSPQCEGVLGYPNDKFIGQILPDIIHPDDSSRFWHAWEQVAQHGQELHDFEYRIVDSQGAVRWVSHSAKQATVNGKILGIQSDIRNITERKQAEEALVENEEQLRTILHSMQTGIIVIDAQTHIILDANQKSLDMIGGTKETVLGSVCHSYICPAELGKCPITDLAQTIDDSERILISTRGKKIPILKSVIPTILRGKKVLIESFIDITDRKRAEDIIVLTTRKLALMNDVTYQYIQNKVTAVRGYAELSKDAKTDDERLAFIEKEEHILAEIHHLIGNTKDYQEMGLTQIRWISVEPSIRMAVSLVSPKQGISIEIYLNGLELYADPLIEKIFYKFIDNAEKHGKTLTRITFSYHETPDGLILTCEDDGVGISQERKARLFERGVSEKSGFDLFFIRECLALYNMSITETGESNKGARFEITVPKGAYRFMGIRENTPEK